MASQKLSQEELVKYQHFIVKCVTSNITLESTAKFGRNINYTVQELVNLNVATLREVGKQIENAANANGSSEFSADGPFKIKGIPASEWIEFLKFQIRVTEHIETIKELEGKIKKLQDERRNLETPEERKVRIDKELEELQAALIVTPATV